MKALSTRLPWAYAIAYLGKDIENRPKYTGYRGPLAIHATKPGSRREYAEAADFIEDVCGRRLPPRDEMVETFAGRIICVCTLVDVRRPLLAIATPNPWHMEGSNALVLVDVRRTESPVVLGRLGLWDVDRSLITYK